MSPGKSTTKGCQTLYARGIDNTTDAISRIKDWEKYDSDRFPPVEDNKDTDDSSIQVNAISEAKRIWKELKGKNENSNKLEILEVMSTSWNTTLEKVKLEVLLNM